MNRDEFDKIVDETTDRVLDRVSDFYSRSALEQEHERLVVRSAIRDGFLNLLFAHVQRPGRAMAAGHAP